MTNSTQGGHSIRWVLNRLPRASFHLVGIRSRCPIRITVRLRSELALWMAEMVVSYRWAIDVRFLPRLTR